ncbi:PH domain-containing protein [Lysobacter korlensis]|uniref:PH domain-containing protein n=1 Tax=Lysobacter korlensis TaxID=553636 RepID=A0ABV6RHZ3_9GAMM
MTAPEPVTPGAPATEPGPVAGEAIAGAPAAEHRLHPMSWLFVLLQQLKQFIAPLIALLVFGQGDRNELWPLIGVGVLALTSLWQYFTYRYGVADDSLVVRSGLLERSLRVIPFSRIHNVALQQSMLHRVFGVAEVRLESAGGRKPEAQMRVLRLDDALALESLIRRRGITTADVAAGAEAAPPLLSLPTAEVVRLGLVSNRGLIVVGAAVAGVSQMTPRALPNLFEQWGERAFGWAMQGEASLSTYALGAASLFVLAVLALRLLSIVLALLQYSGFRLSEHGRRLTVEHGLLARWRTSASRRRIQAFTLREGVMHRMLGRRSLEVDTAVAEDQQQQRALRELAPIATPEACGALITHLLPHSDWHALDWQSLPPHAWRLWMPDALLTVLASAVLGWYLGSWGALVLAWLPVSWFAARARAQRAGYAVNPAIVAVREGWWSRYWRFAEIDKLQSLQLTRSPLDRRCGTATLWLDTAGAGAFAPPLRIRFMPETQARALHASLAQMLAKRPLRW